MYVSHPFMVRSTTKGAKGRGGGVDVRHDRESIIGREGGWRKSTYATDP